MLRDSFLVDFDFSIEHLDRLERRLGGTFIFMGIAAQQLLLRALEKNCLLVAVLLLLVLVHENLWKV